MQRSLTARAVRRRRYGAPVPGTAVSTSVPGTGAESREGKSLFGGDVDFLAGAAGAALPVGQLLDEGAADHGEGHERDQCCEQREIPDLPIAAAADEGPGRPPQ